MGTQLRHLVLQEVFCAPSAGSDAPPPTRLTAETVLLQASGSVCSSSRLRCE